MKNPTVEECDNGYEHPIYTRADYQEDIGDGSTNLDYWEWVEHRRQFYIDNPEAFNWHLAKFKPFTVTVEGSERHDGEKPYTYVIDAVDGETAGKLVLELHMKENDDDDVNLLEVLPGVPVNAGYHWNDLRT